MKQAHLKFTSRSPSKVAALGFPPEIAGAEFLGMRSTRQHGSMTAGHNACSRGPRGLREPFPALFPSVGRQSLFDNSTTYGPVIFEIDFRHLCKFPSLRLPRPESTTGGQRPCALDYCRFVNYALRGSTSIG